MAGKSNRPNPLPSETPLSEHYTIEALVRLSEGRMFYLANDDRPDRPNQYCWECCNDATPRGASVCIGCGHNMKPKKFLVSVRWDQDYSENFLRFFELGLQHEAFVHPIDTFYERGGLCSFVMWQQEQMLVAQSSPFHPEEVLDMAQRIIGVLAYLHNNGVSLGTLKLGNFLIEQKSQRISLFDPDIRQLYNGPVPEADAALEIPSLCEVLRRLTSISDQPLLDLLSAGIEGQYKSLFDFGRAIESFLNQNLPAVHHGNLSAMSDVGRIRTLNEDNWNWGTLSESKKLYIVADGMGGHDCGEVASALAVELIFKTAKRLISESNDTQDNDQLESILETAFQSANNGIKDHSEEIGSDMGTTMVAALIDHTTNMAFVSNVGDSRAYLIREGELHQVSRDHSLVAKMVEQRQLTAEQARYHPHSNILLRTVGTERNVIIDIFQIQLQPNDIILLCSDGLWGEVDDSDIREICNGYEDLRESAMELVHAAHLGGGKDNITVMMVQA